jgi:uncharacterized protein (DUF885 family)
MRKAIILAAALAAALPAAAAATPPADFSKLLADHYAWLLRNNPVQATTLGVREHDDKIQDLTPAARERHRRETLAFLDRLNRIPVAQLGAADRTNHAILKRMLSEAVEGARFGQRAMLFTTYSGWHQSFAGMASSLPFRTQEDFKSYLSRLEQYPRLNDEALKITADAVRDGYVLPCSVLAGYEKTIAGVIAEDPTRSRFYEPFARQSPSGIGAGEWAGLQARARSIVSRVLNPAYAKHRDFFLKSYLPKCAKSDGISAQPGGKDFYTFVVRQHTTTDLTPDQIHEIGLKEIARIRGEMAAVAGEAGFSSRDAFVADLRTNPKYYATAADQLLRETAIVTKSIDGKMPLLFGRLPRLPYGIRPIPTEIAEGTTTAYYEQGSPESGIAGYYAVNTSKLDQRPLWEIPALSLHEAVPGHHHQIALQQELELPPFRRHFAHFNAFTEGWGLYAESLGEEIGLYDTPAKRMGQLSYQAWRASRLVVDTGIHAKGWDKARAVAFMKENTALTDANIDAEVNRYISWPGQALGYKIGELKLKALRARAQRELGPKFDIRRFHDALLMQGSVPLDLLDAQIGDWIAAEKAR